MSALTDLQPYLDEYPAKIRKAKNASGFTLQELSDLSGVPYNNICDTNAGRVKHPLLFYAAATCKVLNLSLNELVGLDDQPDTQRIHDLELEIEKLKGDTKRLEELNAMLTAQAARNRTIIFMMLGVCAMLLVSVIGYVILDINVTTAGLFQSAKTSTLTVFLGLVVLAAICAIGYAVHTIHKGRKK